MMTIEVFGRSCVNDEKLAPIGVASGIGHGEGSLDMSEFRYEFVVEFRAVDTLATHPGTGWITSLDHEVPDDPVENHAIVIPFAGKSDEIGTGPRGFFDKKFDLDGSEIRSNSCDRIALLWHIKLRHDFVGKRNKHGG